MTDRTLASSERITEEALRERVIALRVEYGKDTRMVIGGFKYSFQDWLVSRVMLIECASALEPDGGWISVKDRLPEDGDSWKDAKYMIVFGGPPLEEWGDPAELDPTEWCEGIESVSSYFLKHGDKRQNITHWRRLAPPRKSVKEPLKVGDRVKYEVQQHVFYHGVVKSISDVMVETNWDEGCDATSIPEAISAELLERSSRKSDGGV